MKIFSLLLILSLLSGYGAYSPAPAPDPYAWLGDYDGEEAHATIAGLGHMPLDELPQQLRDSLELVSEDHYDGFYDPTWCVRRTYTAPGLELSTTAPTQAYLDYLAELEKDNRELYPTEEDFWAYVEGEAGREWLLWVAVTDDSYETLYGLKVGQTVAQAEALGYPLSTQTSFGPGPGTCLEVMVEDGAVTRLKTWWGMGRYIGKFWEQ